MAVPVRLDLLTGARPFNVLLDHVRWISAAMVLLGHLRSSIFPPYYSLTQPSFLVRAFYLTTSFADDAVICFFVISGLLIGGKCITGYAHGDFSLTRYWVDRSSRLYTVLVPALLLSFVLMWLQAGTRVGGACISVDANTLVASALFLQNVATDLPCNNHALWSLSNEFWYYLLSPLVACCFAGRPLGRGLSIIVTLCVATFLLHYDRFDSHSVLLYFPIWAVGFLVWLQPRFRIRALVAIPAFAASLMLSRSHLLDRDFFVLRDALIALSLAALLMSYRQGSGGAATSRAVLPKTAGVLAGFSFSLYLVHNPIVEFATALLPSRFGINLPISPVDLKAYAVFAVLLVICLAVAGGTFWAFERNTRVVRTKVFEYLAEYPARPRPNSR